MSPPTLHLVDGSGYIYRAYYAVRPLSTRAGVPTNAVVGFAKMLGKLIRSEKPSHLVMAFDPRGKTFRHEQYEPYKQNRQSAPEDLVPQFSLIRELVRSMDIPIVEVPGFEADDVLATLSAQGRKDGFQVVVVSADKDLMQLVRPDVRLFDPMKDRWYDGKGVKKKLGVDPKHVTHMLALAGDSSDNIPGVPRVGPKTAVKLIDDYGDIESIIAGLQARKDKGDKLKAVERAVLEHQESARISLHLASLVNDVPIPQGIEGFAYTTPKEESLGPFLRSIEAYTLLRDFGIKPRDDVAAKTPTVRATVAPARATGGPAQGQLFVSGQPAPVDHSRYRLITDSQALAEALQQFTRAKEITLWPLLAQSSDLPTEIVGMAMAGGPGAPVYVPFSHRYLGAPVQLDRAETLKRLGEVLQDPTVAVRSHNCKALLALLRPFGITPVNLRDDVIVAAYVLDPGRASFTLDALATEVLGHETIRERDLTGTGKHKRPLDESHLDVALPFAAERAEISHLLCKTMASRLAEQGLGQLYRELEMPLIPVLARMEAAGIRVDLEMLRSIGDEFEQRLAAIETHAHKLAGQTINLASPKQLGALFFETLGYPVLKKTKTGYSTDHEVLETLARDYELPGVVVEHRALSKLKSTYIDALTKLADPTTGRLHTTYNQAGAATGRLSSTDPNLQNIPIRTEDGRRIRRAFIAEPGYCLISADYSQIELRVMAHLSEDSRFVEAFKNDQDIHRRTAMEILTDGEEPDAEARRRAKAINFGILYGLSAFGLSKQLNIPRKDAQTYIGRYFARYPGIRVFLDRTIDHAGEHGFVETLSGRKRYLPNIRSRNANVRNGQERIAMNTPIQGSAADLIKMAMLRVDQRLRAQYPKARMLLQVHDELVVECPVEEQEAVQALLVQEMAEVRPLSVPLRVDAGAGPSWSDAH